LSSNIHIL